MSKRITTVESEINGNKPYTELTKREYISTKILSSLLTRLDLDLGVESLVKKSLEITDILLIYLEED